MDVNKNINELKNKIEEVKNKYLLEEICFGTYNLVLKNYEEQLKFWEGMK